MIITFFGKNMELDDSLKEIAEKKVAKLDKYFLEETPAKVVFAQLREVRTVEITIYLSDGAVLRSEVETKSYPDSMDTAIDLLSRQIRKHKTKLKKINRSNETIRFENITENETQEEYGKIIRRKKFELRPLSEEEAILQMELLNHNFFVFINEKTNKIEVLYKRKDKDYGVIEAEIK